mmetsp:Transcript_50458/g.90236  ORF Transcript_50458/g.90236 Transcript_50458/m.90236 type:complete len:221 (+) Transcript_50458:132-794(+)
MSEHPSQATALGRQQYLHCSIKQDIQPNTQHNTWAFQYGQQRAILVLPLQPLQSHISPFHHLWSKWQWLSVRCSFYPDLQAYAENVAPDAVAASSSNLAANCFFVATPQGYPACRSANLAAASETDMFDFPPAKMKRAPAVETTLGLHDRPGLVATAPPVMPRAGTAPPSCTGSDVVWYVAVGVLSIRSVAFLVVGGFPAGNLAVSPFHALLIPLGVHRW